MTDAVRTGWLADGVLEWQGRPVARRVSEAAPRGRAVLTGRVCAVAVHRAEWRDGPGGPRGPGVSFDATLDDGTGAIVLRWVGRDAVPGVRPGVTMCVQGTAANLRGRLVLLNPLYRFEPCGPRSLNGAGPGPSAHGGSSVS